MAAPSPVIPSRVFASARPISAVFNAKPPADKVVMDRAVTRNARVRTTDRARIPANVSVLEDGTETCVKSPAPTVSSAKTAPSLALHASSVTGCVTPKTVSALALRVTRASAARSPALKEPSVSPAVTNATAARTALNVITSLVSVDVCPDGKAMTVLFHVRSTHGEFPALNDVLVSITERVAPTMDSVDALMAGWVLSATKFVRKAITALIAWNIASAPMIISSATQLLAVSAAKVSEERSATSPSTRR